MRKNLELDGKKIICEIRTSRRAKRMCLTVHPGNEISLTLPRGVSWESAERFIFEKSRWIFKMFDRLGTFPFRTSREESRRKFLAHKEPASRLADNRARYWSEWFGFPYARISIKNQKTCWGSCSRKGNLNFNYRIVHLPSRLADYIIVHEICHLRELNHSRKFWGLVAKAFPDYRNLHRELRDYRIARF